MPLKPDPFSLPNGGNLNSGTNFNNMKDQVQQALRGVGASEAAGEVVLDNMLDALGNYARDACYDRQRPAE